MHESIVGGAEVIPHSLPWTVGLIRTETRVEPEDQVIYCGGALISSKHVLTAAHCTLKFGYEVRFKVIVGEHHEYNETDGTIHTVASVVRHPEFISSYEGNDIALVTLEVAVVLGPRAVHVCLPTAKMDDAFLTGKSMTASGWGTESVYGDSTDELHSVELPYVNITTCQSLNFSDHEIKPNMFCAGDVENGGVDTCNGDSGGKLDIFNKYYT